jgi:putative ABC transport system ATP-binding protein
MSDGGVVCHRLTKAFQTSTGSVPVLRGVDLTVRKTEVMFLVGPSGCGKTTLISIIAGMLHRDSGECLVFGTDLGALSPDAATAFRRDNIGFVFQSYNLIPSLSVRDNVMIPLLLQGAKRTTAALAADATIAAVGLREHADNAPAGLSGGQQQRAAIARAIVHAPRLVVCDEPTSALDHATGQDVMTLLRGLAHDRGMTLIVVTHDQRIYHYADRIAEMDDGRIVAIRNSAELANVDTP